MVPSACLTLRTTQGVIWGPNLKTGVSGGCVPWTHCSSSGFLRSCSAGGVSALEVHGGLGDGPREGVLWPEKTQRAARTLSATVPQACPPAPSSGCGSCYSDLVQRVPAPLYRRGRGGLTVR